MNLFTSWLKDQKTDQKPQSNPPVKAQNLAPRPQTKVLQPQPKAASRPTSHSKPSGSSQTHARPQQQHQTRHASSGARHGSRPPQQRSRFRPQPKRYEFTQQIDANVRPVPALEPNKLRVITLGGLEEVGKNSIAFEYGDDIIIVDMGLQFPDENMHGIDYAVADYGYLKGKEKNIKGIIITHGHLDHIGGIPHVMPKLGVQIPMYCTQLTAALINKRQEETKQKLNVNLIKEGEILRLGHFTVDFFRVNHSIPGAVGVFIKSPAGNIVHTGDWKIDLTPVNDEVIDFIKIAEISKQGVLAAFCDSTNAASEGFQLSESAVRNPIEGIFMKSHGRIIVGTFASNLSRVQQIIGLAEQYSRRVVLLGRTMTNNVLIARNLKYIKVAPHTLITIQEADKLRPEQVVIILTGAQGEKNAALMRVASGEHKYLQIQPDDTVIFSSSIVPGNEQSVGQLMDRIYRLGAKAVNYRMMEIHAGGHAKAEDTKLLIRLLKPKYFVPIEGNHYLLKRHAEIAEKLGYKKHDIIIPDNGTVIDFDKQGNATILKEKAPHNLIAIDGLGMGDVGEAVLNDRHEMAQDGVLVVTIVVDKNKPELRANPDIITRGFIYLKGSEQLLTEARDLAKETFTKNSKLYPQNIPELKNVIQSTLSQFLFTKTERQPMVLPMIIQV